MAPATLKRSDITMFISALSSMPRWKSVPSRRPTTRAGMRNAGRSSRATRVICQLRMNIVPRMIATRIRLPTTLENRSVKACWAPMTSLLSRLMSAPVWVREKKAMGMRWMCS